MILTTVLIAAMCGVSFAGKVVAKGKSFTALGDYTIEQSDKEIPLKGSECKAYVIKYENSPLEVTVAICKDNKCKKYVVLSDKLSVQYVCNPTYFGVERLSREFEKEGHRTVDEALNRMEYFHQKVLGSGQSTEIESTQLIAAYFPKLINPDTEVTASR